MSNNSFLNNHYIIFWTNNNYLRPQSTNCWSRSALCLFPRYWLAFPENRPHNESKYDLCKRPVEAIHQTRFPNAIHHRLITVMISCSLLFLGILVSSSESHPRSINSCSSSELVGWNTSQRTLNSFLDPPKRGYKRRRQVTRQKRFKMSRKTEFRQRTVWQTQEELITASETTGRQLNQKPKVSDSDCHWEPKTLSPITHPGNNTKEEVNNKVAANSLLLCHSKFSVMQSNKSPSSLLAGLKLTHKG